MKLIEITNLTKTYKVSKNQLNVLKDISLILPQQGLVVILGKSGSGKSTLLNIIGGIDKPSKGKVNFYIKDKIKKFDKRDISFIFQHYHLLENETPLYNVMLPALIQGFNKNFAKSQAEELIKLFKLDESIINKETRFLSGGEKERIAILRALITNPKVILADEPTGALDKDNAIKTMQVLKNASEKKLVILVTHNKALAKKYADRIITLSDGRIVDDKVVNQTDEEVFYSNIKRRRNDWSSTIINHNFKKRIRRNIVSILGMTISLIFCYLLFGFSNNSNKAINEVSYKHFDYGTSTISKEFKSQSNSSITLVKTIKPEEDDLDDIKSKFPMFEIMTNYDAVFNVGELYLNNKVNNDIHNSFVYDFSTNCFDKSLILNNDIPKQYSWNDVVINKKAKETIGDADLHFRIEYENKVGKNDGSFVIDYFEVDEKINVITVVDEFDFLSTPKIYFDYLKIEDLFDSIVLENYSEYKEETTSWKKYIEEALPNDSISSYSSRCFLLDINYKSKVEELSKYLDKEIKLSNDSLSIKDAVSSLTIAATVGLDIFLVIALIGSVLILGVFSYSAYNDDKKESSMLSCLGANTFDVVGIFASESLIVTFFSFLFSSVFAWLLQTPINFLLVKLIDIPNLIDIPFKAFMGIRGLLPLGVFFISCFVTLIFSSIPILINKQISLKKELSDL